MRCAWPATYSHLASVLMLALLLGACTDPRPNQLGVERCPTYETTTAALLQSGCGGCHGSELAEGGYQVDSYAAAVSRRADGTPRAAPGDLQSLVLQAVRGELAGHSALSGDAQAKVIDWLVRCEAPPKPYSIHENGWMDAQSTAFHGAVLRSKLYDDQGCRTCHGEDLSGGKSQIACASCHAKPLDSCGTCHGNAENSAPPRDLSGLTARSRLGVGAHQKHVADGPLHKALACSVCHPTPEHASDEGHYQRGGQLDEGPAEVTLAGGGVWRPDSATCTNVYCHSPAVDSAATNPSPVWTDEAPQACGTCHGLPPSSHNASDTECVQCHRPAFAQGQLLAQKHVNGTVELSGTEQSCVGCHGTGENPAPPVDLLGSSAPSSLGVGAHEAHVKATHRLSAPVACTECHRVPTQLRDEGHIDSARPAEVFPASSGVGLLASKDGAMPGWNREAATCTTYCHGAGAKLSSDSAASLQAPVWTGGTQQAGCGTCHGLPPSTAAHSNVTGLASCVNCHPGTVTAGGAIKVETVEGVLKSQHIDGVVQATP